MQTQLTQKGIEQSEVYVGNWGDIEWCMKHVDSPSAQHLYVALEIMVESVIVNNVQVLIILEEKGKFFDPIIRAMLSKNPRSHNVKVVYIDIGKLITKCIGHVMCEETYLDETAYRKMEQDTSLQTILSQSICTDGGNIGVFDEYYDTGRQMDTLLQLIKRRFPATHPLGLFLNGSINSKNGENFDHVKLLNIPGEWFKRMKKPSQIIPAAGLYEMFQKIFVATILDQGSQK